MFDIRPPTATDGHLTPKVRRRPYFPQPHRRNSFPSSKKDGLEYIGGTRVEAKSMRERGVPTSISNEPRSLLSPVTKRKNTMSGIGLKGPNSASGPDGYLTTNLNFDPSSDFRSRASTASGLLLTPIPVAARRSSHISGVPSETGPRLENGCREATRLKAGALPATLWDYLMLEMENSEIQGVEEYKKERLSNFLKIPESFEKVLTLFVVSC
jgi:hypothetical protein